MTDGKKKIDGRTKDEIIRDLRKEIGRLNNAMVDLRAEHQRQWDKMCPFLPDEMRARARAVWEAALHSHETATDGQPGPIAVVAGALTDAERIGPRSQKGGVLDPVAFIAQRIKVLAQENGRDEMDFFRLLEQRMNPARDNDDGQKIAVGPGGQTIDLEDEGEDDDGSREEDGAED